MLEKVFKSKHDTYNGLDEWLDKTKRYLNPDLIQKHFKCNTLGDMLEYLFRTKGTYKNSARVSLIKAGLRDLERKKTQMPRMEIIDNEPNVIVNLVEKILNANERQIDRFYTPEESPRGKDFGPKLRRMFDDEEISDMSELESEESAEQRRKPKGEGLKTFTPQQKLSGLPIFLAQLKTGNTSEKLKNEIRQLLYYLSRSKS